MKVLVFDPEVGLHDFYVNAFDESFFKVDVRFAQTKEEIEADLSEYKLLVMETSPYSKNYDELFEFLQTKKKVQMPVVVVSEFTSERLISECILAGAADFLSKRNLKHGRFGKIVARALTAYDTSNGKDEEYRNKLSSEIRLALSDENAEKLRHKLVQGIVQKDETVYQEGENYTISYLYAQLRIPESLMVQMGDRILHAYKDRILNNFNMVAKKYGRRFGLRKEDACFFAFGGNMFLPTLLAAMEMNAQINMTNITQDKTADPVGAVVAICRGETTYTPEIGSITSDGLNFSAHMAIKKEEPYSIFLSGDFYENIGQRAQNYFVDGGEFEGRRIYKYVLN